MVSLTRDCKDSVCHGIYVMASVFCNCLFFSPWPLILFHKFTLIKFLLPQYLIQYFRNETRTKQIGKWEEMWIMCPKWFSYSILPLSLEHSLGAFPPEVRDLFFYVWLNSSRENAHGPVTVKLRASGGCSPFLAYVSTG